MADDNSPRMFVGRKFGFPGFCLVVAIILFAIQQGCSVTGTSPSWIWGTVWFGCAILLILLAIWFWDRTASHHWLRKLALSVVAIAVTGGLSYIPIVRQYRIEHPRQSRTELGHKNDTEKDSICTPASLASRGDASLSDPPRPPNIGFIGARNTTVSINSKSIGNDIGFDDSCTGDAYHDNDVAIGNGSDLAQWYTTLLKLPSLDKSSVESAISSEQSELKQWGRRIRPDIVSKLRSLEDNPDKLRDYLKSVEHPQSKPQ